MQPAPATSIQGVLQAVRRRWGDAAMIAARCAAKSPDPLARYGVEGIGSAHPALASLGAYVRRGQIVEITGGPNSGKSSLALGLAAALLQSTEGGRGLAAYVDSSRTFYPPGAAAIGIDLRRLWVVRLRDWHASLAATEVLLKFGVLDVVLWDLVGQRSELTGAQLQRLRMAAAAHGTTLLLLTAQPLRPSHRALDYGAAVRLVVHHQEHLWECMGEQQLLAGYRLQVEVARAPHKPTVEPIQVTLRGREQEPDGSPPVVFSSVLPA